MCALPKVDFSRFLGCSGAKRATEAREIVRFCSKVGFLWLDNTQLTPELINRANKASRWLMAQPAPYKRTLAVASAPSSSRGEEVCSGRGYYRYVGAALQYDAIEAYQLGNDCGGRPEELRRPYFEAIGMPEDIWLEGAMQRNRWPDSVVDGGGGSSGGAAAEAATAAAEPAATAAAAAECREALCAYFDACTACTEALLCALELGLGLRERSLLGAHARQDHTLEVKRYPAIFPSQAGGGDSGDDAAGAGTLTRIMPHADLSTLTPLTQDSMGGLEVQTAHGAADSGAEWLSVPADEGKVLVNTGDFMARWSAGQLPSTIHRVVDTRASRTNDRFSLVFFACPDWDAPLNTLGEQPPDDADVDRVGDIMPF